MTITSTTLLSSAYTEIKNFINTNITDPKSRYKKQWVHATLPNLADDTFDGYPFVVVDVDMSEEDKAFDRSTSVKRYRIRLGVYSEQATEVDSISDQLIAKFKDETLTNSLSEFKSIEIGLSPFDFTMIGGKKISRRFIGLIGRKRL